MEYKNNMQKAIFTCSIHGTELNFIESFYVDNEIKTVSILYCNECRKHKSPYLERNISDKDVKCINQKIQESDISLIYKSNKNNINEDLSRIKKEIKEKRISDINKIKTKEHFDNLKNIEHFDIILTNKTCFLDENKCPQCQQIVTQEEVKISHNSAYLITKLKYCKKCDIHYISPELFYKLEKKASKKSRGYYQLPFINPRNVSCENNYSLFDEKYYFIPKDAIDFEKYNHRHLPSRIDKYYDMTDDDYCWVISFYSSDDFSNKLKQKSILGEEGYSTNETTTNRHTILKKCINKYGKDKVIQQLHSNINIRINQNNNRYAKAINIWRADISFIEKEL